MNIRIPLHGKGTLVDVATLHQTMNETNPQGFRTPPTSRHNPASRSTKPVTRLEKLYAEMERKA